MTCDGQWCAWTRPARKVRVVSAVLALVTPYRAQRLLAVTGILGAEPDEASPSSTRKRMERQGVQPR